MLFGMTSINAKESFIEILEKTKSYTHDKNYNFEITYSDIFIKGQKLYFNQNMYASNNDRKNLITTKVVIPLTTILDTKTSTSSDTQKNTIAHIISTKTNIDIEHQIVEDDKTQQRNKKLNEYQFFFSNEQDANNFLAQFNQYIKNG